MKWRKRRKEGGKKRKKVHVRVNGSCVESWQTESRERGSSFFSPLSKNSTCNSVRRFHFPWRLWQIDRHATSSRWERERRGQAVWEKKKKWTAQPIKILVAFRRLNLPLIWDRFSSEKEKKVTNLSSPRFYKPNIEACNYPVITFILLSDCLERIYCG